MMLAAIFSVGCATKVDLAKFHNADLPNAEIMPSNDQLKKHVTKVAVCELNTDAVGDVGKPRYSTLEKLTFGVMGAPVTSKDEAQFGVIFESRVKSALSSTGAEVISHSLAGALGNELKLAESGKQGTYSGPPVAEFAICGKVLTTNNDVRKVEATSWKDKDGKTRVMPAYFIHSATLAGTLSVYEVPSLRLLDTIKFSGSASSTHSSQVSEPLRTEVLGKSMEDAMGNIMHKVKNFFAPNGYVLESRTDGKTVIFRVSMGTDKSAHSQDKVEIYSLKKRADTSTDREQFDEVLIGKGIISDQITQEDAWIVPKPQSVALGVKKGDFVRVRY